eukprot:TRINITY_DN4595_c0_g1_i1.p1 TRINITY_DN4595_c0_g1~~TRINITY_DN4595_c0_g1_i1.p1  ORF type:complete len:266 (-),score=25.45 TRINITY_DN4595_c0_g1_i1:169-966(-)
MFTLVPYNLNYNHEELFGFMRYSINDLAIHSNHQLRCPSRPFELCSFWISLPVCGKLRSQTIGDMSQLLERKEISTDCYLQEKFYQMEFSMHRKSHIILCLKHHDFTGWSRSQLILTQMARSTIYIWNLKLRNAKTKPVIINVNIGTTVKGAVDDLLRILRVLDSLEITRDRYYIHCDGALFALMLPFVKYSPEISFKLPIDSISVSGHKFLGCPMPCGIVVTRKNHVEKLASNIEYLNSRDTTIMGIEMVQAHCSCGTLYEERG